MPKQAAPMTYRIRLESEVDGKTICSWGKISEDQIRPMLRHLRDTLPLLVRAARAKHAFSSLFEAFR